MKRWGLLLVVAACSPAQARVTHVEVRPRRLELVSADVVQADNLEPAVPSGRKRVTCAVTAVSEDDAKTAQAYYVLARRSYDEGDYERATGLLWKAYEIDCSRSALLDFLASAYIARNELTEAITVLEVFLERDLVAAAARGTGRKIENLRRERQARGPR